MILSAGGRPPFVSLLLSMKLKIPNLSLYLFVYFFCNVVMTGEPTHTVSRERMAPELMFSSERASQLSITDSKAKWPLCIVFSHVQLIIQCYKQRTVLEVPLQYPHKIRVISVYKHGNHTSRYHESTPWTVSKKKWDTKVDKGKSMMHTLYVLWYAKRHVSGQSDIEQRKIKHIALAIIELRLPDS